jgi:hypothetical protein
MSTGRAETTEPHLAIGNWTRVMGRFEWNVMGRFEWKVTIPAAPAAMTQTIESLERTTCRSNENCANASFDWNLFPPVTQRKYHGGRATLKTGQSCWSETNRIVRHLKDSFCRPKNSEIAAADLTTLMIVKSRRTGLQNCDPGCSLTAHFSD